LNRRFSIVRKLVIVMFLAVGSGAQAGADRTETLGEGLICMCGCNQLLSGCEMIKCPAAPSMRKELKQYVDIGEDDKTIFASFAAKYGPKVLSAPATDDWFNLSAWVMPFVALAAGAVVVVFVLKRVRAAQPAAGPSTTDAAPYEKEIEEELRKLTPED
jgi:cytochrome c-type biogenesis protein CcmH/NrfF